MAGWLAGWQSDGRGICKPNMHRCLPQTPAAAPGLRFTFTVSSGSAYLPAKQIRTFTRTVIISLPTQAPARSPHSPSPRVATPLQCVPLSKPQPHHTPGPLGWAISALVWKILQPLLQQPWRTPAGSPPTSPGVRHAGGCRYKCREPPPPWARPG